MMAVLQKSETFLADFDLQYRRRCATSDLSKSRDRSVHTLFSIAQ